jgi:hypothetical protein
MSLSNGLTKKKTVLDSLVIREDIKQAKIQADSIKRIKVTRIIKDSLLIKKPKLIKKRKDALRIQ